jgi:hypothetical protein
LTKIEQEEAETELARGEGRIITREYMTKEYMRRLSEDVKQRGRARLAAEQEQVPR